MAERAALAHRNSKPLLEGRFAQALWQGDK